MNEVNKSSSQKNFVRAVENLKRSFSEPIREPRDLSGIIKDFEMAYELSWKVLKKILLAAGHQTLGAKDVFTKAYQLNYIKNESVWLSMIEDRNQSAHVYDENDARKILKNMSSYLALYEDLVQKL